jgi:MFS transporter, DHA1 family, multidrug resistance protein
MTAAATPVAWQGTRWKLALLLACLGMVGPFAIDTYLPAFSGIARALDASPVQMQQTLSSYLFGFALMNLFHGALADALGRRPVVLAGVAVFTLASVGCAVANSIGELVFWRAVQGMSAGVGMVVSRAMIRDLFPPADAQRVMSQVTIFFGVAPAVAPLIGGWLFAFTDWHVIFWLLAVLGALLWVANWRWLPESLPAAQRQPFRLVPLMCGYTVLLRNPRYLALVLASGIPFNGMFLYVLSAPAFLGDVLQLAPTQFFWFFVLSIGGMMSGAALSGRLAGRIKPRHQIRHGFVIMLAAAAVNVAIAAVYAPQAPQVVLALLPVALFSFGWALQVPVVTILALDQAPDRRGTASSVQACIGSLANGIVAGVLAPLVMHSALGLALTSAAFLGVGAVAWLWVKPRLPVVPMAAAGGDQEGAPGSR